MKILQNPFSVFFFLSALFVTLPSCTQSVKKVREPSSKSLSFSVMTYNVENLFDTKDNPLKNDEEFLPLAQKQSLAHKKKCQKIRFFYYRKNCFMKDWSEQALSLKIQRIKDVLESEDLPEVLFLQEVETLEVLKRLNQRLSHPYPTVVLLEDIDPRGIDIGILSSFPLKGKKLHPLFITQKNKRKRQKRAILEVLLELKPDVTLHLFGLHFPSAQAAISQREEALLFLNELARNNKDHLILAAGDFNINSKEAHLYDRLSPFWKVAQKEGCASCLGTYYYKKEKRWSFLDSILVHWPESFKNIRIKGVEVVKNLEIQGLKTPQKFQRDKGVSDHFPLKLTLEMDY